MVACTLEILPADKALFGIEYKQFDCIVERNGVDMDKHAHVFTIGIALLTLSIGYYAERQKEDN